MEEHRKTEDRCKHSEKEIIERFLCELQTKNILDGDGFIRKTVLRDEFRKYIKKNAFLEYNKENMPEICLKRYDLIKCSTNRRLKLNIRKRMESKVVASKGIVPVDMFDCLLPSDPKELKQVREKSDAVDLKSPEQNLTFDKGNIQNVKNNFDLTFTSCFICQENFPTLPDYDNHLKWHGKEQNFPIGGECESHDATFKVSYKLCRDSYYLYFAIRTVRTVLIEKVIIVRPDSQRSMNCVHDSKFPINIKEGDKTSFYVNCFLFNIGEAQPFVIIYRLVSDKESVRRVEQHLFLRQDNFPQCSMKLVSTRVPERGKLEFKGNLKSHFPTKDIQILSKLNYKEEEIMKRDKIMGQYLLEKNLKSTNFYAVLLFLLQVEDHYILSTYYKLDQRNKTVKCYCDEFSVTITRNDVHGDIKIGEILEEFDEVILSYCKDLTLDQYIDENTYDQVYCRNKLSNFNNKRKFFNGTISKIQGNTVLFKLYTRKTIPTEAKCDIRFLPSRWFVRYQYHALEMLKNDINIQNLLFPTVNFNQMPSKKSVELFNKSIEYNPEQLQAVRNIADGPNESAPYIIFGPPGLNNVFNENILRSLIPTGTGKTTTVVESVLQLWKTKPSSRILITAGSNAACDEVAKRLCRVFGDIDKEGWNILRIYAAAAESRTENAEEILVEASNFCYGYHFYPSLQSIYLYRILVVTLAVCGKLVQANINKNYFSHIFIDECGASTEPEAMVGIAGLLSPKARLILSGDPKQLGPVLKNQNAEEFGLCVSLIERLLNRQCYAVDKVTGDYNRSIQTRLTRNFRTHPVILNLSNRLYYNNELIPSAKSDKTHWALGWQMLSSKKFPLIFHCANGRTVRDKGQKSLRNNVESEIVLYYVRNIMQEGINGRTISEKDIGIISPYKRQCDIIREKLCREGWYQIEVGSVEVFQGQEKPIILVSTVRSNTPGVGFLDSPKRLNVTLTRAKALLIIIGNPETLQVASDWKEVIKYCQENNALKGKKTKMYKSLQNPGAISFPNVPLNSKNSMNFSNTSKKSNSNDRSNTNSAKYLGKDKLIYSMSKLNISSSNNVMKAEEQSKDFNEKYKNVQDKRAITNNSIEARESRNSIHKEQILKNSNLENTQHYCHNSYSSKEAFISQEPKVHNLPTRTVNEFLNLPGQSYYEQSKNCMSNKHKSKPKGLGCAIC